MTPAIMMNEERVILVNELDEAIGTMGKAEAHATGTLHRAFSIFLFHEDGRLLLQQRASTKYHSADLWTNTCCSHPRPGEGVAQAAQRRLQEEMGITTPLHERFSFTYRADVGEGLIEHEFDHVFFGTWSGNADPDPNEVQATRFVSTEELDNDLVHKPALYTAWLHRCWPRVKELLATSWVNDITGEHH